VAPKAVGSGQQHPYVNCLGALTGGQAVQQAKAGIKAIYLSGWQVAADNNEYAAMYPDQSLYPVDSVPKVVERINNAFNRADEIQWSKNINPGDAGHVEYHLPIVADAEAGFGGVLNAYELMKAMIRAGAAGVHWEDQLASVKKCGHMGGKVLVPTTEAVQKLIAARMAADVYGVPTLVIARTDAEAADLLTSDYDENDKPFLTGERTPKASTRPRRVWTRPSPAPSPTLTTPTWCGAKPARRIWNLPASSPKPCIRHPGKMLAYNCSPSFNWKKNLDDATIAKFQRELGAMGYKYQFITLAGIHNMWYNMFDLAQDYAARGMSAYVEKVQEPEFAARDRGYTFVSHQQEVGTGYFDDVTTVIQGGKSSVTALTGSTEGSSSTNRLNDSTSPLPYPAASWIGPHEGRFSTSRLIGLPSPPLAE
jgi:isocitrate lyase